MGLYYGTAFALIQVQTAYVFRLNERDTVMPDSRSAQTHVGASEDSDCMLFSAWLLACALLLEAHYQQLSQCQAYKERVEYAT